MTARHDSEADVIISAELGRCVLGAVARPELRVDVAGELARMAIAFHIFSADLGARLLPVMQEMALSVRQIVGSIAPPRSMTARYILTAAAVAMFLLPWVVRT